MPLASLDLRRNKDLMAAIMAAISAYLDQERQALVAVPVPALTLSVPEPGFWRILRYMIFQR